MNKSLEGRKASLSFRAFFNCNFLKEEQMKTNKNDITLNDALLLQRKLYNMSTDDVLTMFTKKYKNIPMAEVFDKILMHSKQYYLKKHKYKIALGSDGRYRTRVHYPNGKVKQVTAKSKKDIEKIIINHYKDIEDVYTIEMLFSDYIEDRKKYVRNSTIQRDKITYNRMLKDTPIIKKNIRDITVKQLSDFCRETIIRLNLNKKSYSLLKTLLNAFWDFAYENGYAASNIARNMRSFSRVFFCLNGDLDVDELNSKYSDNSLSRGVKKAEVLPQYYNASEEARLIETCLDLYEKRSNTAYLAIIMNFCLGLRIGELVALKPSDFNFDTGYVHVQRREITDTDLEKGKRTFRISPKMKNPDSNRFIPISPVCRAIFDMVVEDNEKRGLESEFLFNSFTKGERMNSTSVDRALDYANNAADLKQRSIHKIRKTVLSRLDMSRQFTLEMIRELAGHSRESMVLYTNYFYTIEGLEGIRTCENFADVVEFKIPDIFGKNAFKGTSEPLIIPFRKIV